MSWFPNWVETMNIENLRNFFETTINVVNDMKIMLQGGNNNMNDLEEAYNKICICENMSPDFQNQLNDCRSTLRFTLNCNEIKTRKSIKDTKEFIIWCMQSELNIKDRKHVPLQISKKLVKFFVMLLIMKNLIFIILVECMKLI